MNLIKSIFYTLKPSLHRFLSMYIFCALGAVFTTICIFEISDADFYFQAVYDCAWVAIFSILVQLTSESFFIQTKIVKLFNKIFPILFSIPFYFFCATSETNSYFWLIYIATILAEVFFSVSLIASESKEKAAPNIFVSASIAGILCGCVGTSLTIILLAIKNLIFDIDEDLFMKLMGTFWSISVWLVFVGFFVSYITRKYEKIEISKAFKFIFLYALFPLYIILVIVLYVYIFKSVFTLSLPSGMINPFVSTATCVFLVFYLTLQIYDNKAVRFFKRFGGFFMLPLIGIQIVAFVIRVNAYGLTMTRYASLIYIVFSLLISVVAIKRNNNLLKIAYFYLSCFLIYSCLPKLNLIDVSEKSMRNNIEKIYKAHNLFDEQNQKLITENASEILNADEKKLISTSISEIEVSKESIPWIKIYTSSENHFVDFKETFGFEKYWKYSEADGQQKVLGMEYNSPSSQNFDISGFSKLHIISNLSFERKLYNDGYVSGFYIKTTDGLSFAVTENIRSQLSMTYVGSNKKEKLYIFDIEDGKYRVICTSIRVYEDYYNSEASFDCYCSGFILESCQGVQ